MVKDVAFLLTVGSFLLTMELFYLQLTILAFLLTVEVILLTVLTVELFYLQLTILLFGSLTVSKEAPTVSKKASPNGKTLDGTSGDVVPHSSHKCKSTTDFAWAPIPR